MFPTNVRRLVFWISRLNDLTQIGQIQYPTRLREDRISGSEERGSRSGCISKIGLVQYCTALVLINCKITWMYFIGILPFSPSPTKLSCRVLCLTRVLASWDSKDTILYIHALSGYFVQYIISWKKIVLLNASKIPSSTHGLTSPVGLFYQILFSKHKPKGL
jgi:hypothetical protein